MADSNVTTYDAYFGGTICGSAPLVSNSGALSGAGETGNKSTSSRSRGRRDDASSDYRLVAYTEGTSSAFGGINAHRFLGGQPTRYDTSVDMADGGFMQVALNSSSPRRLSSRASTASTSSSTSTTTTITFSVWDGDWAVLEEYTTGNVLVESYVQGYHGLVKTLVSNVYYYQDELGSTSHVASGTGALIESYQYDLYGKPRVYNSGGTYQPNATPLAKDLGNGGGRWIPEIGLYDDRNRFMSPDLGRFLQPDPIGFKGDASNLYRYVGNDWANKTDPTGLGERESNPILQEQIRYNEQLRNSERGAIMGQLFNVGRINVRDAVKDMAGFTMGNIPAATGGIRSIHGSDMPERQWSQPGWYSEHSKNFDKAARDTWGDRRPLPDPQTMKNAPALDTTHDIRFLTNLTKSTHAFAAGDGMNGKFGKIYIAKEVMESGNKHLIDRSYGHELGNVLSTRLTHNPDTFGNRNTPGNKYGDPDTGAQIDIRMFGPINY
jgi:RHS repeat-associated protein